LVREIVPRATRIVAVGNVGNQYSVAAMKLVSDLAVAAGLRLQPVEGDAAHGISDMLTKLREFRPEAVLFLSIPAFLPHRKEIVDFMATNRLPAIYPHAEFVEAGGLICYATNFDDLFRRAADYVDKILRGAAPGEMPVQQASSFRFIVNLKAARAIGLTMQPSILVRATEVIE
jgi:putative ABC transport system substrate-binding protein